MKTRWPYAPLNDEDKRRATESLRREHDYAFAQAGARETAAAMSKMRAVSHIDASASVTKFSVGTARALATSLEVNRETGWRDNKLCRRTRDICSCLHFIGGYPATSNKRTNGLIRNNNDTAECGHWGQ